MLTRLLLLILLFALTGCSTTPPLDPAASANHPANPDAAEAPIKPLPATLAADASAESAAATTESIPAMEHAGHEMGGMNHVVHGNELTHPGGGTAHDTRGIQRNSPTSRPATTQAAMRYTCPMHPEIVSDKPGKCPKCGMKLIPISAAKAVGGHQ